MSQSNPIGPRRIQIPTLFAGLLAGALLAGGLVPLVGADIPPVASGTPGIFGPEDELPGSGTAAALTPEDQDESERPDGAGTTSGASGASGSPTGPARAPGASPSQDPAAGQGAGLPASDVGVTAETIRIGALTLYCPGCAAFAVQLSSTRHRDIAQAFADDVNRRGGIHGRRLELFTADYDPVEDGVRGGGTQRAGCIELTARRQVFAVLQGGTFSNACIYLEHGTPLITHTEPSASDPDSFNQSGGMLWTVAASSPRTLTNWARQLVGQGLLTRATRFGVVTQQFDNQDALVDRYLIGELARLGVPPTHVAVMPANLAMFPVAASTEVAAMRRQGVDHVLLALDQAVNSGMFIQQAERDGWRPQYLVSEFPTGVNDFTGGQQPPSFDGAIAIANTPARSAAEFRAQPLVASCLEVWERHSGRPTLDDDVGWVLNYCNSMRIFERAATAAGPVLTRESLVRSLAGLGQVDLAGQVAGRGRLGGPYGFGSVKWSAVQYTNTKVWHRSCPRADTGSAGCWIEVRYGDPMDV
jgi:hypothetical protein